MKIRKAVRVAHLWLGLVTGLVVFILGLTGCIYVFADDIREQIYRERYFVTETTQPKQTFGKLLETAQRSLGKDYKITRAKIFNSPERAYEFRALKMDPKAFGHWKYYVYYYRIYLDPYTAKVIYKEDAKNSFMGILLSLHMYLLLGKAVGHMVVRWAVVGFVILLISGIFLWWPKHWTKKQIRNSFTVKWGAKFRRLNYDLHNVAGFYSSFILLIIALTGLTMSFELSTIKTPDASSDTTANRTRPDIADYVLQKAKKENSTAAFYYYNIPAKAEGTLNVSAYASNDNFYDRRIIKYDQFSGDDLYKGKPFGELTAPDKVKAMNFDLHTGAALGLTGKILAFLASLVATSLPITGIIMWLNKKKSKKKEESNNQHKFSEKSVLS